MHVYLYVCIHMYVNICMYIRVYVHMTYIRYVGTYLFNYLCTCYLLKAPVANSDDTASCDTMVSE